MPHAVLLSGYPPASLFVTTPNEVIKLVDGNDVLLRYVTISRDGVTIASARLKKQVLPRRIFAIATYSLQEHHWIEHDEVEDLRGGVAISPDGLRLAYVVTDSQDRAFVRLRIIDLRTKRVRESPLIGRYTDASVSWSPDGNRLGYDMNQSTPEEFVLHKPAVFVLDVETSKITSIAKGKAPAWSPSGEWIAYFDNSKDISNEEWTNAPGPDRLSIIRPDGTGATVLVTLPKNREFATPAVWSPDSKTILLNEALPFDKGTVNVHLLNVTTRKMVKKFYDVPPIFAWANAK